METATATTRTEMVTATDTTEPAVWTDDDLARLIADEPMFRFVPRPDCPEEFDQQSSFLRSRAKVSIAMGATGVSGPNLKSMIQSRTAIAELAISPGHSMC